jgi:glutamate dehydrogenase (NADP+)
MLEYAGAGGWAGKRVAISGSGNVAQYAALKCIELGATVVSLSDSKGAIIAEGDKFVTPEDVATIADLKVKRQSLTEFKSDKFKYVDAARPWTLVGKVDVALPCATQNEVSKEEAEALLAAGAKFVAEGSNMGCTQGAIDVFEADRKAKKGASVWYAPGK